MSTNSIYRRMASGMTPEEAMTTPSPAKKAKQIAEAAQKLDLSVQTIRRRIRSGMTPEEAITTPSLIKSRYGDEKEIAEAARRLGLTKAGIKMRIDAGMDRDKALTMPKVEPKDKKRPNPNALTSYERPVTVNGVTHTLREWSEINNISFGTITSRIIGLRWDPVRAVTEPLIDMQERWRHRREAREAAKAAKAEAKPGRPEIRIEAGGVSRTLGEWSKITKISRGTLYHRKRTGWTPEQIVGLLPPPRPRGRPRHPKREKPSIEATEPAPPPAWPAQKLEKPAVEVAEPAPTGPKYPSFPWWKGH